MLDLDKTLFYSGRASSMFIVSCKDSFRCGYSSVSFKDLGMGRQRNKFDNINLYFSVLLHIFIFTGIHGNSVPESILSGAFKKGQV